MSLPTQHYAATKRTFWAVAAFYFLIAFEFFYMASPFAVYFYSVYRPSLNVINSNPLLAWLSTIFLPHIAVETASPLINLHNIVGAVLATLGFAAFCLGAGQVYYHKFARKGAVTGGIYNIIRHPQYLSFSICSFGLLLLWPRFIVLLSFIAMLFAYYFLAKVEENECEQKFGESYRTYKRKTNMFLPFRLPFVDKLPALPKSGIKRYAAILALYVLTSVVAIGLALGVQRMALNSLYALYTPDAAYISVNKAETAQLQQIVDLALSAPDIQQKLSAAAHAKFINYVLPAEWNVSEIPMNTVGAGGHLNPATYDRNLYRIVFTRAELRNEQAVEGQNILLNTAKRIPLGEVVVDLAQHAVVETKNPPEHIKFENVPVPLY